MLNPTVGLTELCAADSRDRYALIGLQESLERASIMASTGTVDTQAPLPTH